MLGSPVWLADMDDRYSETCLEVGRRLHAACLLRRSDRHRVGYPTWMIMTPAPDLTFDRTLMSALL
jgi:hypothetical protein